jgi:hypothetical protein
MFLALAYCCGRLGVRVDPVLRVGDGVMTEAAQ